MVLENKFKKFKYTITNMPLSILKKDVALENQNSLLSSNALYTFYTVILNLEFRVVQKSIEM